MRITKAISVRSPWWWFILNAGKDIENRDWPTKFRGTIYLHASKTYRWQDVNEDIYAALGCCGRGSPDAASKLRYEDLQAGRGCIVGQVDIVDCVQRSSSPWFFGRYGFVLENSVIYAKPYPCKGALGLFTVPDDVLRSMYEVQP